MKRYVTFVAMMVGAALCAPLHAEVQTRVIAYRHGDVPLRGYLAWDDRFEGKRPGVMVVHEWWGLNDYVKRRTRMLAELGYVAFAADMYGDAKVTEHGSQAQEWMEEITANIDRWRERALAGFATLQKQERVDGRRIAAIGYCFGGATVLQMAYAGAELKGAVSFHGMLPIPSPTQAANIKARILAHQGSEDQFVPLRQVELFQAALDQAGVDWHMVIHGGARHGFTNPDAQTYGVENIRYDRNADRRSWSHMKLFFEELFAGQ